MDHTYLCLHFENRAYSDDASEYSRKSLRPLRPKLIS